MVLTNFDLAPIFWGGLLIGLVIVFIGLGIRSKLKTIRILGTFLIVAGGLLTLAAEILLISDGWKRVVTYQARTIEETLTSGREIQGLRLPRGTTVQTSGHPRLISKLTLIQPLEISGIPFEHELDFTRVDSTATSVVKQGTLAAAHVIDGVPCQPHSDIQFNDSVPPLSGSVPKVAVGALSHCTSSAAFETAGIRFAANSDIYINGGPKAGTLDSDQDLEGVPCLAHKQVEFTYLNGTRKLIRCTLSKVFEVHGTRFAGDSVLELDAGGNVTLGLLAADQDFGGRFCKKGTQVQRFSEHMRRFTPARDVTIAGIAYKAGGEIIMNGQDEVESAVLARHQQYGAILCRGGDAVLFYFDTNDRSNHLDACVLSHSLTLLNVQWPAGSRLTGLMLENPLEVTLPETSGRVTIGDATAVGSCKVQLRRAQPYSFSIDALPGKAASFVELTGARFSSIDIHSPADNRQDGSGAGEAVLIGPATLSGTAFHAGDRIHLNGVHGPVLP